MSWRLSEKQFRQLKRGEAIGRTSKYFNKGTVVDGIRFSSAFEAAHYGELKVRLKAGEIRHLLLQVAFPLVVKGTEVCRFICDFQYEERVTLPHALPGLEPIVWVQRIVDTKSEVTRRTAAYRIKNKLMAALGHEIVEVVSPSRGRRPRQRRPKRLD